jgi:lipopolysaccharide transport system permease protein
MAHSGQTAVSASDIERFATDDRLTASTPTTVIEPRRKYFDLDLPSLWEYRELVYFMIWRDVKTRYKQTVLGVAWAVLQPVMTMLVFWIVFSLFARLPSNGMPYPLFAMIGLLPWTYFSQAVARSSGGLVGNANLISKVYFPRLIIPLSAALSPMVDLLLSFLVLIALMAWYAVVPGLAVLTLPLFVLLAFVTALGVSLWLSALYVKYRDVGHLVPFVIQIWMYASPVIYPLTLVPERWRPLYSLNPMVAVIEGFRWALSGGAPPDLQPTLVSVAAVIVVTITGLMYFRRTEREFADVI